MGREIERERKTLRETATERKKRARVFLFKERENVFVCERERVCVCVPAAIFQGGGPHGVIGHNDCYDMKAMIECRK